jgi:hypothetical protein
MADDKDILQVLGEITATQKLQQEALRDISDTCRANTETLIKNTEQLEYHIRRTDIIEEKHEGFMILTDKRLDLLENDRKARVAIKKALWKTLGKASFLAGAIVAIIEAIRALMRL